MHVRKYCDVLHQIRNTMLPMEIEDVICTLNFKNITIRQITGTRRLIRNHGCFKKTLLKDFALKQTQKFYQNMVNPGIDDISAF